MGTRRLPGMPHVHSLHLMFCDVLQQHPTLLVLQHLERGDSATRTKLPKDSYIDSASAAF